VTKCPTKQCKGRAESTPLTLTLDFKNIIMTKESFLDFSGKLTDIAPDKWFTDKKNSSFRVRLYTSLYIPHDKFKNASEELFTGLHKEKEYIPHIKHLLFGGGTVSDLNVPCISFDMYANETGKLVVDTKVDKKLLKTTNYIILAVPFQIDGVPGDEYQTGKTLDSITSIIRIHAGQNFMREIVFDAVINASNGDISTYSDSIKMPQIVEGPFIGKQHGEAIKEISKKILSLHENNRERIELALELVNEAMDKKYGFFEYWTALEIVCDGKSGKIKNRLAKIYNIKSHNDAAEKTGLKVLAEWRHDFIHKGKRPIISADVERYIQLIFLELLRDELGLPCAGHLAAIQQAKGYDLTPLGLKSNKPTGQTANKSKTD